MVGSTLQVTGREESAKRHLSVSKSLVRGGQGRAAVALAARGQPPLDLWLFATNVSPAYGKPSETGTCVTVSRGPPNVEPPRHSCAGARGEEHEEEGPFSALQMARVASRVDAAEPPRRVDSVREGAGAHAQKSARQTCQANLRFLVLLWPVWRQFERETVAVGVTSRAAHSQLSATVFLWSQTRASEQKELFPEQKTLRQTHRHKRAHMQAERPETSNKVHLFGTLSNPARWCAHS